MRNQRIPACRGSVLYRGIGHSCVGYAVSVRPGHGVKAKPGLPQGGGWPSDPWAAQQAAGLQEQTTCRLFPGLCHSKSNPKDGCCTERSVLAQPTFVFEKKDRPLKRPAEDPVCKAENDFISFSRKRARSSSFTFQKSDLQSNTDTTLSQKRGRSSSFTILPTFPPSQTVKKNNIFMTSALLQRNTDSKSTKEGCLSQNQLWNVIRPAILQPPQARTCPENPIASQATETGVHGQLSEDSSYSSAENSGSLKTVARSSITVNLSSPKTIRFRMMVIYVLENLKGRWCCLSNQLIPIFQAHSPSVTCTVSSKKSQQVEDRRIVSSSNSDFVFGENMVERVLSPEKHPETHNGADSYKGEVTSMYIESFNVHPQTKTSFMKNATLTESAVACISKPVEKILLDKIEIITGEEAEHNVLQINCKLFVFNKFSLTWIERGRGSLRLNDTSSNKRGMLQSRLIMRNQGSLRLILNTRLWDQMVIKRANRKSLCFTATDQEDHSVQVFLIQASSKDAGCLYAAIHHRLVALRSFTEQESDANQIDTESEIAFHPLNYDSDDDDDDDDEITQASSSGSDHSRWNRRQPVVCS
ncbi:ran-binding protein 3-like isoform X2 [Struthio camelus]|uniref:ran-binding protein 3-like isoform X2 n=1 Tax=Struthio camelus TaxID=8801 RepID=UPI003603CA6E